MDDWSHVGREGVSGRYTGGSYPRAGFGQARIAEPDPTRLGGRQRLPRALGDHFSLMLRHSCQNVNGKLIGVRIVYGHEFNTAVHQRSDKRQIAAQPVELRNDEFRLLLFAGREDSPAKLAKRIKRRWRVVLLRAKGEILGTVEASDVASAKAAAAIQFDLDENQRNRIMVQELG